VALAIRTSVRYYRKMAALAATLSEPRGDATLLARAAELSRPVTLAGDQVLLTLPVFAPLFPWGGLQRGTVVAGSGPAARSLLLALAAGPVAAGAWVAVLGVPTLGLLAASELGLPLSRLVSVSVDAVQGAVALGAALDAFDVVVVGPGFLRGSEARRVQARARDRGSVLLVAGDPGTLEVDSTLHVTSVQWEGLHDGHGSLRARQISIVATGRRAATRARTLSLWLPNTNGEIEAVLTPRLVAPARSVLMPRSVATAPSLSDSLRSNNGASECAS
jgi:hypothetical protein